MFSHDNLRARAQQMEENYPQKLGSDFPPAIDRSL